MSLQTDDSNTILTNNNLNVNSEDKLSTLNYQLSTINYQLSTPLGQYDITNRIMYLSKQSNITTFQHEMMHWWRQTVKIFADVGNKKAQNDIKNIIKEIQNKEQTFKNFEIQTIRTQQSGLTSSLSLMQQNSKNVFVRMYLAFKNQNLQFLRKIYDSIIMYQNGDITKKELAKTLTLYILIQPKIYTLISAVGYKLFRDRSKDDDEDDTTIIGDIFQNIIKAPIDGIPIITDIYDFVANKVRGKKNYKVFSTPMLDDITTAMKKLNKNDITIKDYLYFIASFGEVTTGIPFHNINKLQRMVTKKDLLRN